MSTLNYQITELNNGIRIVTETVTHVQSMAMGVWVGVGSRYETEAENGITHFIEHMLFKGTKRRSAQDIAAKLMLSAVKSMLLPVKNILATM